MLLTSQCGPRYDGGWIRQETGIMDTKDMKNHGGNCRIECDCKIL